MPPVHVDVGAPADDAPAVAPRRRRARPPLLWIGAGAAGVIAIVIVAVVALGGGDDGGAGKRVAASKSARGAAGGGDGEAARVGQEESSQANASGSEVPRGGDETAAAQVTEGGAAAGAAAGPDDDDGGGGGGATEEPAASDGASDEGSDPKAAAGTAAVAETAAVTAPKPPAPVARPRTPTLGGKRVVVEYDAGTPGSKQAPKKIVGAARDDTAAIGAARITYFSGNRRLYAGDADGAIRLYRQALGMYPGYVAGYRGLGLAYSQKGDRANALKAFRTYLSAAPGAKDGALVRKRITMLQARPRAKK